MNDYEEYKVAAAPYSRMGYSTEPVRHIVDGDTKEDAFPTFAASTAPSWATSTGRSGIIPTHGASSAKLFFAGKESSASENKTFNYRVLLYRKFDVLTTATTPAYVPEVVAAGVATVGSTLLPSVLGSATADVGDMWVDTLAPITPFHSGVFVNSPADNTVASIEVDLHNACAIEVQGYIGTVTSWDAFLQFGEPSVPFDLAGASGLWPRYVESEITMVAEGTGAVSTSTAGHKALLVTGLVRGWIVVECTSTLESEGEATFSVGTDDDDDGICGRGTDIPFDPVNANTLVPVDGLDIPKASYMMVSGDLDCLIEFRSNGIDIEYYVNVVALAGGALKFHCWYQPLEPGAFILPGAGGTT